MGNQFLVIWALRDSSNLDLHVIHPTTCDTARCQALNESASYRKAPNKFSKNGRKFAVNNDGQVKCSMHVVHRLSVEFENLVPTRANPERKLSTKEASLLQLLFPHTWLLFILQPSQPRTLSVPIVLHTLSGYFSLVNCKALLQDASRRCSRLSALYLFTLLGSGPRRHRR